MQTHVLDLSGAARLEATHREWLNEIAGALRGPYTDLVGRLGAPHGDSIDWWVTPIASRNIFASSLFLRCCQMLLALRVADSGHPARAYVVETPALARALNDAFRRRGASVQAQPRHGALRFRAGLLGGMCHRLAAAGFHVFNQFVFSRLAGRALTPVPAFPVVLLDTFVYRDSFERGYRDRYYPGLIECLTEDERKTVWFLPSYYKIRNYPRFFRELRGSAANFLVKEDYLRIGDYAHALAHPFRQLDFTVGACELEGHEISGLVNEAVYEGFASSGSIEALLRYRLSRRLSERGVAVKLVVDWFENQETDHGSNAGFRRHMPETPVVGYQGFIVSPHYLCAFPTAAERDLKLIPQRVAVMGPALTERAKEFCPQLEVGVAPAFRFSGIWADRGARQATHEFRILVALPLMEGESAAMLELMQSVASGSTPARGTRAWRVRVKAHPAFAARLPGGFELIEGDFDALLDDCDVLVSAASSVCVQALAHGVPVVVLGNSYGITLNPIPGDGDPGMWALCYTSEEVTSALAAFAQRDEATLARHRAQGLQLRERYFSPVTPQAVRELLMFPSPLPLSRRERGEVC